MTYKDGEIKHILPSWLKEREDVQAISYAIKQQIDALELSKAYVYGYAFVDGAPEYVLDLMAVELNVRYYNEGFSVGLKRDLIKNAIITAMKDGTVYAVDSVISTIWGDGHTVEWMEYSGTPNHFRIELDNIDSFDRIDDLIETVDIVKRKTARLDAINMKQPAEGHLYFGEIIVEQATQYMDGTEPHETTLSYLTDENDNILMTEDNAMLLDYVGGD